MARDITSGFQTEIEADSLKICRLVKAEFDGGDVLIWSGEGDIVYNSDTYTGAGTLLGVSEIQETQELRATGAIYELSGVPSSLVSLALSDDYQTRPITSYFGVMDDSGLIADPYKEFSGKMDIMEMEDSGDDSRISVSAESDVIDLRASKESRYTPEDQKIDYPLDEGFDFVPFIQDTIITWGAGRTD